MPVEVVRVGAARWQAYRDIRLAGLIDSPRAFGSTYAVAAQRTDADWRTFVGQGSLWLALEGDRPLGTIGLYADPEMPTGSIYLVGMWVATQARGRGVGDALVAAVLQEAGDRGLERVVLHVAVDNAPAIGLYTRHGFTPTGRTGVLDWDAEVAEAEMELLLTR